MTNLPTGSPTLPSPGPDADSVREELLAFLRRHVKDEAAAGQDIFASGLVSSLFAMQLVVHIESRFDVEIESADLKLDNFRTVDAMTALVLRLRERSGG